MRDVSGDVAYEHIVTPVGGDVVQEVDWVVELEVILRVFDGGEEFAVEIGA